MFIDFFFFGIPKGLEVGSAHRLGDLGSPPLTEEWSGRSAGLFWGGDPVGFLFSRVLAGVVLGTMAGESPPIVSIAPRRGFFTTAVRCR